MEVGEKLRKTNGTCAAPSIVAPACLMGGLAAAALPGLDAVASSTTSVWATSLGGAALDGSWHREHGQQAHSGAGSAGSERSNELAAGAERCRNSTLVRMGTAVEHL